MQPVNQATRKVRAVGQFLIGSPEQFTLEQRVYHTFCLIAILVVIGNSPFRYSVDLYISAGLSVFQGLLLGYAYYRSRFFQQFRIAVGASVTIVYCLLAINYFLQAGLEGPSLLFFNTALFATLIILPQEQRRGWMMVNLVIVLSVMLCEYLYPSMVINRYPTRNLHFLDVMICYGIVFVLIAIGTPYIIQDYNRERQRTEDKARMMAQLNQEKSKIFSIISHDLFAPLASVQHYLELLLVADLSAEKKRSLEADLFQATRATLETLTNLLSWSKGQMQGIKVTIAPVDMSELIYSVLYLFEPIASHKHIQLEYKVDEDIEVEGDADLLLLIIRNLINNAVKFTDPDGYIVVSLIREDDKALLVVKDSGNGARSQLPKDVFQLGAQSTMGTNNEKGIGLGLLLCKEFVEAQKGRIWFANDPLSGTTFYVELPLHAYNAKQVYP